jgi:NAD(P)-dependent dehydrogenase (short-subunit alcohol dehydrogenase family)
MSDAGRPLAIVTGGTRGIGLGVARALAGDGWDLALCGLRAEDAVGAVLEDLRSMGADVVYCALDVSQVADHQRFLTTVAERWDRIDALVNNAGRAPRVRADLLEASEASFDEVLRANLYGPYFLTQRVARALVGQRARDRDRRLSIVFVTSVSATLASVRRGEYCVSKAGLAMAARLFAVRLAADGIAVYDVRPGIIETDMTAAVHDDYDARIANGLVPARRWGTAEDVGRVVAALVRGDLPYATGSVINVDGGLSIPRL